MLADKDRIFTNLYGFQSPDLKAAQARGDWDGTANLMKAGEDAIIETIKAPKFEGNEWFALFTDGRRACRGRLSTRDYRARGPDDLDNFRS
jgi:hypothetical protein